MRLPIFASCVLLASFSTCVFAAPGVALRWSQCYGDGGAINRNFACDTNAGTNILVGSFQLAAEALAHRGNEIVLDIAAADPQWPAWWAMKNPGTCRPASLTIDFLGNAMINCPDWANGQAAGAISSYLIGYNGPNTARILAASAVPAGMLDVKVPEQEYFSFRLKVDNAKTAGAGACAGCDVPVCIVLQSIKYLTPLPQYDQVMTGPFNGTDSHYVTWQGGGSPTTPNGTGCPAATPARRETWGAVKALYR